MIVDTTTAANLRDEEDTAGQRISDPTQAQPNSAYGLPRLTSHRLPVNTAIVMDSSRVFLGMRAQPALLWDEYSGWENDITKAKVRTRIGGLSVAEATSVQAITVAGS